jgi:hypothetical protein
MWICEFCCLHRASMVKCSTLVTIRGCYNMPNSGQRTNCSQAHPTLLMKIGTITSGSKAFQPFRYYSPHRTFSYKTADRTVILMFLHCSVLSYLQSVCLHRNTQLFGRIHWNKCYRDVWVSHVSRKTLVGITKGYGLNGQSSIPGGARYFSLIRSVQTPIQHIQRLFSLGAKRLGCEAEHSPPSYV